MAEPRLSDRRSVLSVPPASHRFPSRTVMGRSNREPIEPRDDGSLRRTVHTGQCHLPRQTQPAILMAPGRTGDSGALARPAPSRVAACHPAGYPQPRDRKRVRPSQSPLDFVLPHRWPQAPAQPSSSGCWQHLPCPRVLHSIAVSVCQSLPTSLQLRFAAREMPHHCPPLSGKQSRSLLQSSLARNTTDWKTFGLLSNAVVPEKRFFARRKPLRIVLPSRDTRRLPSQLSRHRP